jgi:RNA polymerase sigma-70 factor (ECF subfamily)
MSRLARTPIVRTATVTVARVSNAAEDAGLVRDVGQGDQAALAALYDRYGKPCYALARRILGDDGLAEDVVQEVFLVLWRDPSRFDSTRGAFATWLLSTTHHKAVDAVRREENHRKRRASADVLDSSISDAPAVEEQAWTAVRRTQVRSALATLPPTQREALGLAYLGGYTQREIAGLTGIPLGTVKTRMLAGMRRLREELAALDDSPRGTTPTTSGEPT